VEYGAMEAGIEHQDDGTGQKGVYNLLRQSPPEQFNPPEEKNINILQSYDIEMDTNLKCRCEV
jgi:hypothetical protein